MPMLSILRFMALCRFATSLSAQDSKLLARIDALEKQVGEQTARLQGADARGHGCN
jgi:hypothetical protein